MIILCYHNGALGHAVSALIECCTIEGSKEFQWNSFSSSKNLHHYEKDNKLFIVKHPDCDVDFERSQGHTVISSSSTSIFGRLLIILMGLQKWNNDIPDVGSEVVYKQNGQTYGDQIEILAITLKDKILDDSNWFVNTDHMLDITNFWLNVELICDWLTECGFTPVKDKVKQFSSFVAYKNQSYYDTIKKCFYVVNHVNARITLSIDLSFYEVAMCYALLLNHFQVQHDKFKILQQHPTSTRELIEIFYDNEISRLV